MKILHKNRIIIAGLLSNLLTMFDLALCGIFAIYLYFKLTTHDESNIILIIILVISSYCARLMGAMILGVCADIYGRQKILALSIIIMGIATASIGFLPSYQIITTTYFNLLIILRCMQSFYCGSIALSTYVLIAECADEHNKGFASSWAAFGTIIGLLLAFILILIIMQFIDLYPINAWWLWRIPFLIAFCSTLVGYYIRNNIPEGMEYVLYYSQNSKPKIFIMCSQIINYIVHNKRITLRALMLNTVSILMLVLVYIYPIIYVHIHKNFTYIKIIFADIISLYVVSSIFPVIGQLSDLVDRNKIILYAMLGFIILIPLFLYILFNHKLLIFMIIQGIIALPIAAYYAITPVILAEIFPIPMRCTLLSITYTIATIIVSLAFLMLLLIDNY